MTFPVYKIEIREPDDTLRHTITKDAINIRFTSILTTNVGTFSFSLPTKFADSYKYNDVEVFDKVKIWLDHGTVPANPLFAGRILRINAPLAKETGYVRVFKGRDLGEVLLRRFKRDKAWVSTGASTIVTELANDLSLGTGEITADATSLNVTVETEPYFDLLQRISDYYDAGGSVLKDFAVDISNNLRWKTRPWRTVGVESLVVGESIETYDPTYDVDQVKNKIRVYGEAGTFKPPDQDASWTENTTDWTVDTGENLRADVPKKVGTYAIYCYTGNLADTVDFNRTITSTNIRFINELRFYIFLDTGAAGADPCDVRLHAPDASNYFKASLGNSAGWTFKTLSLGASNMYDVDKNPDGEWVAVGSANWWDIREIQFIVTYPINDQETAVDGMYFVPDRYVYTAEDGTSQTDYGVRDFEFFDDHLTSNTECEKRAKTFLYQLKDPATRLDVTTRGNPNILIGDRLSMTIPAEGISAENFDVVSVTHMLNKMIGFKTFSSMVNTAYTRDMPATAYHEVLRNWKTRQNMVARGRQIVR